LIGFSKKLNTPVAVVVILVLFLVVDGFLFYRYQQLLPSPESIAAAQPNSEVDLLSAKETSSSLSEGTTTAGEEETAAEEANVPPGSWENERSGLEQASQAGLPEDGQSAQWFSAQTKDALAPPVEDKGQYAEFPDESDQYPPFTYLPQE
jgi:hypothetical protein